MEQQYNIKFFEQQGRCPVTDFIRNLDSKKKARTFHFLDLLAREGPSLREPHSRKVRDGIFELRCKFGNNHWRFLYFYSGNDNSIVIVHAFIKKDEKTPERDLHTALQRKEYYLNNL